jgi:cytochrome oxidase Cu insertion factor (SCO1/SenC/PrrC family)
MASRCFLFAGLCCLALVSVGRPLLAEEAIVPAPQGAASEPAETVRLAKDGPYVPWDALRVGNFSLVDQLGRPVTNESLRGKPWIANFIFTRCTVSCPLLLKNTYELQRQLEGVDFRIVSITVDPEHDTIDVMKKQSDIFAVRHLRG